MPYDVWVNIISDIDFWSDSTKTLPDKMFCSFRNDKSFILVWRKYESMSPCIGSRIPIMSELLREMDASDEPGTP